MQYLPNPSIDFSCGFGAPNGHGNGNFPFNRRSNQDSSVEFMLDNRSSHINNNSHNMQNDMERNGVKLCKFGTECKEKLQCSFNHDMIDKMCKEKDKCKRGKRCLLQHTDRNSSSNMDNVQERNEYIPRSDILNTFDNIINSNDNTQWIAAKN